MTVSEVAVRVDRSLSTVRQWCIDGAFPNAHYVAGKAWCIPSGDLRALERRRAEPRVPAVRSEEALEHDRAMGRARGQRKRDTMRIGHAVPGCHGHSSRMRKEAIIQETVVRRRCEACEQVFEAKVKEAVCLHCGYVVEAK